MKSAQITRYGNTSEVIKINQTNAPNLSTGKVLVNVQVAGINPIDWKIREGYMQQMIHLQFPSTLGMDFSGIIKQVGEEISSDFKQGDKVYGQAGIPSGGSGAFAEQALASVTSIAHKPRHALFTEVTSSTAAPCKPEKSQQDGMEESLDDHGIGSKLSLIGITIKSKVRCRNTGVSIDGDDVFSDIYRIMRS